MTRRDPDRARAPRLFGLPALLRRGWIVPVVVAAAAFAASAVADSRPVSYLAESVVVVYSGADREGPGQANDANSLARTYAQAIPEDQQIVRRVSRAVNRPAAEVREDITVVNDTGTSVLRLQYTSDVEARAVAGARALGRATLTAPRRSAIGRRSLRDVRLPDTAERSAGDAGRAVPIGIALGLALALLLMVGWERSDPRLDGQEDVRDVFDGGVTHLRRASPEALGALRRRWGELAGRPEPTIALIAATRRSRRAAERLAAALGGADAGFEAAGPPGGGDAAEGLALRSDLVVLVAVSGTPVGRFQRTLAGLDHFGRRPRWVVLTRGWGPRLPRGRSEPAPAAANADAKSPEPERKEPGVAVAFGGGEGRRSVGDRR